MSAKIWAILGAAGAGILAIFAAFAKGASSARDKMAARSAKKALKTSQAVSDQIVKGAKKQETLKNAKVDTDNRDHFNQ